MGFRVRMDVRVRIRGFRVRAYPKKVKRVVIMPMTNDCFWEWVGVGG